MSYIKRVRYMTKCPPYTNPKKITPTKAVLHSTGCAQQKIAPYINGENKATTNAAVHGFIGEDTDGTICFVQTLPFNYRGWHVGSGSKGSYNNNGPGIEICEPSGGQTYKAGVMYNFDKEKYRDYFNKTKQIAIEVFGDFCKEYGLDPYKAIVDHQEAHKLGYGSNHGDIKHWWDKMYGYTMDGFRKDVADYINSDKITIMGKAKATAAQMKKYIAARNKDKKWQDIVDVFLEEGKAEGVKGDVAFAQSCLETGNFKFTGDVDESQNNFAGIGTTGGGVKGHSFKDVRTGVRAQIQHLKAYASKEDLKNACVDPRFKLVNRGSATTVEALSGKWAASKDYGKSITRIYKDILATSVGSAQKPEAKLKYTTGNYKITTPAGLNVRSGPGTQYDKKPLKQLTAAAQKLGGYKCGVVFTALEVVNKSKEAWARTPSGWVCLELNGDKYVKKA